MSVGIWSINLVFKLLYYSSDRSVVVKSCDFTFVHIKKFARELMMSAVCVCRQLLGGIDKLHMVSGVLASTDQVVDMPADGATASEPNKQ